MTLRRCVFLAGLLLCAPAAAETPAPETKMPAPVVFFDIAGPESAKLKDFYAGAFGWNADAMGRVDTGTLKGALRQDPAATVIYLGVPDVTAALKAVEAGGGKVVAPRFEVKGVVVLGLFKDPAGNTVGLVETKDGKAVVP
jgi:predicted enzyme related to lactoylglutathione lyase